MRFQVLSADRSLSLFVSSDSIQPISPAISKARCTSLIVKYNRIGFRSGVLTVLFAIR